MIRPITNKRLREERATKKGEQVRTITKLTQPYADNLLQCKYMSLIRLLIYSSVVDSIAY